jgi:hypothetical protein
MIDLKEKYTQKLIDLKSESDEIEHMLEGEEDRMRIISLTTIRYEILGQMKAYKTVLEDLG